MAHAFTQSSNQLIRLARTTTPHVFSFAIGLRIDDLATGNPIRILGKETASAAVDFNLSINTAGTAIGVEVERAGSAGDLSWTVPAANRDMHLCLTWDLTTSNDPVLYFDGVPQASIGGVGAGSGLPTDPNAATFTVCGTDPFGITRNLVGHAWEVGWWEGRILSQAEVLALAQGCSPALFPERLIMHLPLDESAVWDRTGFQTVTSAVTSGLVPHRAIIRPTGPT